jgi:hypothetical protein
VRDKVMSYLTKQPAGTQTARSIENFLRMMRRLLGKVCPLLLSARNSELELELARSSVSDSDLDDVYRPN